MNIIQLLKEYKADKYNGKISPEYKIMLDAQVGKVIEEHIELLRRVKYDIDTCWVGLHKDSVTEELKTNIRGSGENNE
ncbi:MAG: hypothetical protein KAI79_14450 [Bacteroidales bacterium]|nr:hypothetical protein [Bacteroidales bacterium]